MDPRRSLAPVIAAAALVTGCAGPRLAADGSRPWGVQLYTLRADMARDPIAALDRVAALGVGEVEFAGSYGREPASLCAAARARGMRIAAAHAEWQQLRDDPAGAVAAARALCADTIMLAWLPPEERATRAQWLDWIARLNTVAALARAEGLRTAYHAHDFEFAPVDGVRPIDLLFAGLDPAIGFEMDTYWIARAGKDPLAFLAAHANRITHLHLKDMAADGTMADVGHGTLPMARIIAQARAQGVRHFLIERDDAPDGFASLAASLDSLDAMPFQPR